jgi:radical SAM-linked protein
MRAWIRFTKDAPLRFISHLDLMRCMQRAFRRAGLSVAYSAGFNPHPRISLASALPVGVTSEDEFLDVLFSAPVTEEVLERLQGCLPQGIRVLAWRDVPPGVAPLMSLIGAARWRILLKNQDATELAEKIKHVLAEDSLPVLRESKKGKKTVDIRPFILELSVSSESDWTDICMLLKTSSDGGAKAQEILSLLGLEENEGLLHRTNLYISINNCLQSPLCMLFNKNEVSINAEKDCYQL